MAIITVEQVRAHLSGPAWNDAQRADCQRLIDGRQARLQGWLRVPIDPVEITEQAPVDRRSGLVMTTYPIHTLLSVNGDAVADGDPPPSPYALRENWLYDTSQVTRAWGYMSAPYTLTEGAGYPNWASVHYLGGWGAVDDLVSALLDKVGNCMLNRHDDTLIARNLDTEKPKSLDEDWSDQELLMLRARRRPVGARRL